MSLVGFAARNDLYEWFKLFTEIVEINDHTEAG